MEGAYVITWIGFGVIVGILAQQRGRMGAGWGLLSLVISPLIAGIILFIIPNLKEEWDKKEKEEKEKYAQKETEKKASLKISGADFMLRIDKLRQLKEKNVINDIEYSARKIKIIDDLKNRLITDTPEIFLGDLIPLLDNDILTKDEMDKVKQIVYKE